MSRQTIKNNWTPNDPVGATDLNNIGDNLLYILDENVIFYGTKTFTAQVYVSSDGIESTTTQIRLKDNILCDANDFGNSAFTGRRNSVITGDAFTFDTQLRNSVGDYASYGKFFMGIFGSAAGNENGVFTIAPKINGTQTTVAQFREVAIIYKPLLVNTTTNNGVDQVQVDGSISCTSLNTGQGSNELYAMNQNVRTTDTIEAAIMLVNTSVDNGSDKLQVNGSTTISSTLTVPNITSNTSSVDILKDTKINGLLTVIGGEIESTTTQIRLKDNILCDANDFGNSAFIGRRDSVITGDAFTFDTQLRNSVGDYASYGKFSMGIFGSAAGNENGVFTIAPKINGTQTTVAQFRETIIFNKNILPTSSPTEETISRTTTGTTLLPRGVFHVHMTGLITGGTTQETAFKLEKFMNGSWQALFSQTAPTGTGSSIDESTTLIASNGSDTRVNLTIGDGSGDVDTTLRKY